MNKPNTLVENGRMYYDYGNGVKHEIFNSSTKKINSECIDFSQVFLFIEFDDKNDTNSGRLMQYGDLKTLLEKDSSYDKGFYHYVNDNGEDVFLMNFGNGNVFTLNK